MWTIQSDAERFLPDDPQCSSLRREKQNREGNLTNKAPWGKYYKRKEAPKKWRYQNCRLSARQENFRLLIKRWVREKSGYIILEDVPDGKWPRCCFCRRPRFVLLHRLQDTTGSTRQQHADTSTATPTHAQKKKHYAHFTRCSFSLSRSFHFNTNI